MRKIMVPIDFSENSIIALETAIELANKIESDLRLVYVKPTGTYAKGLEDHENSDDHPQAKLDKLLNDYRQAYAVKGKFDYKIREGNIAQELINQCKYDDCTLVVTGSHGVSGLSKSWIGGNAYKMICNATCPVLVIRQDMQFDKRFKKIVIPVDVKKSSRRMMPTVAAIAKVFSAKAVVIGLQGSTWKAVFDRITRSVAQVVKYLENLGVNVESSSMLVGKDYLGKLLEVAKTQNADIMTVDVTNTGSFLADRFRPQLTTIINSSPCPVLVIPVDK